MAKYSKEKEMYGELVNIEEMGQYMDRLEANWNHEYSKAFNIYDLKIEDLKKTFNWYCPWTKKNPVRPYQLMGQIEQTLLLVRRTDTNRYYRMPTKEVAEAMKANLQLDGDI